jgi:hypothetical protein
MEGQGCVRVVVREDARVNGDVHIGILGAARDGRFSSPDRSGHLLRHERRHLRRRARRRAPVRVLGGITTSSVTRLLMVPSGERPTANRKC